VNLRGAVTWAFEFEGQPYFAGFRDLATNGIDKPVLNVFRMLGKMTGDRIRADSSGAVPLEAIRDRGVREAADVGALASRSDRAIAVLIWHYHDDDLPGPAAAIDLSIEGVPSGSITVTHDRVDADHGNSYEAWKRMGSPEQPSASQVAELERAGQLAPLEPPRRLRATNGRLGLPLTLPRQGVSLIRVTW
jgi:xylan 1,4-beta-xylosidase